MKELLKDIIRLLYPYFKNKNKREFYRIYSKWGGLKRYKQRNNVRFLSYKFDIPDLPSFIWQFKELFVDDSYKFISDAKVPIIIDCGANIGTSCLYFKVLYPNAKIIAFEADKDIYEICISNLQKNSINDVDIIHKAVWIDDKGIDFCSDGADGGSIQGQGNKNKVPSIRLKTVLEEFDKIDLLKIDIEGAEYEVLKDCKDILDNVNNIFIEYHSWNSSKQKLSEILEILEKNDFRYYIEGISNRKVPFINQSKNVNMDLQLNIFGIKNEKAI